MQQPRSSYTVQPFPLSRRFVIDSMRLGHHKHTIHGLIRVDVTEARRRLHRQKAQTGEAYSFTAFILACLGRAVESNKAVHSYRNWRGQLILFDDVDVVTIIEIDLEKQKFPLAYIVRSVNRKTVEEIHREIRAVQAKAVHTYSGRKLDMTRWFLILPAFIRILLYRVVGLSPLWWKRFAGTAVVSSVGMFGSGGGWGVGIHMHTLALILGGIETRVALINGQIENREDLCVTISLDHDLVDGAPAARFVQCFKELIESTYGLSPEGGTSA
jgi:pyruvate/2-oxoglutarate dehydrogenase complex dihydrolipoamide acyltransferase (E2) component